MSLPYLHDDSVRLHDYRTSVPADAGQLARLRRAVQAARRAQGLDDVTYRDLLAGITGKRSSTACTAAELMRVLDALNGKGGAPDDGGVSAAHGRVPADSDMARKVRALVLTLWSLGAWDDPTEAGIAAFVRRQAGVDDLRWLTPEHYTSVIEALRAMCARAGLELRPRERTAVAEIKLARAQLARLEAAGVPAGAWPAMVARVTDLSDAARRRLIRDMGAAIRRARP